MTKQQGCSNGDSGESTLRWTLNDMHGELWNKIPFIWKIVEKNKGTHTNGALDNRPMYISWTFQFNVINVFIKYIKDQL